MKNLFLVVVLLSLITSCKKDLEPQSTTLVAPPVPENANVPVAAVPPPQTVQNPANTNVQAAPQQVAVSQKVAKGMNPPHGQPKHRCDIAVGAPLNSPISKTTTITAPPPTNGSATIIPVKTAEVPAPAQVQNSEVVAPTIEKKAE